MKMSDAIFDFRTRIWRQCKNIVQENVSEGSFVFGKTKSSDFVLPYLATEISSDMRMRMFEQNLTNVSLFD